MEKRIWENSERDMLFSWERDVHYPNFAHFYYLEPGTIVSVRVFAKPNLPKLVGICVKSKETIKSIRSNCICSYTFSVENKV